MAGGGIGWSLRSLTTQTSLWFQDSRNLFKIAFVILYKRLQKLMGVTTSALSFLQRCCLSVTTHGQSGQHPDKISYKYYQHKTWLRGVSMCRSQWQSKPREQHSSSHHYISDAGSQSQVVTTKMCATYCNLNLSVSIGLSWIFYEGHWKVLIISEKQHSLSDFLTAPVTMDSWSSC